MTVTQDSMNTHHISHISFLLRLWQADSSPAITWVASLEDTSTGERKGFANVDLLAQYLRSLTVNADPGNDRTIASVDTLVRRLRSLSEET